MEITDEKLASTKTDAESFYKTIRQIDCPYFHTPVSFNAKGIEHLKFKKKGKARLKLDQYIRFRLLKLAPVIIQKSHTLQEFFETNHLEQMNTNSQWQYRMVNVKY
ncbi:MAG: hypothetical protein WCV88_01145 [Patescibacteria group bacterium]|jgi:hypothetical protein